MQQPMDAPPTDAESRRTVLTVGDSTRPIEAFIELLRSHGVTQLVDVRTVPRSRHCPQQSARSHPPSAE
jgi:hypothetical protein